MPQTFFDGVAASEAADLKKAESKSSLLLTRYGISEPGFDIEALARTMGIVVRHGGLENADAWLFRRHDGHGVLRITDAVRSRARRRFSIAHELGHWEMHPELKQGRYCTEADLTDYVRSPEEVEANCFAASLLMPRFLMRDRISNEDPSFDVVDRITSEFETSRTAAARRLVELTKHRVMLVCSTDGQVNWRVKSESAKFYALASKTVPGGSLTARTQAANFAPVEQQQISPSVWLKENPVSNPQELFEDTRRSARLNMALTLLWFV